MSDPRPGAPAGSARGTGWVRSAAMIAVFDIAGPVAAYALLRSAGISAVTALIASGAFPAAGVLIGFARRRQPDVIGMIVLAGISVGAALGAATHDPRLVLAEGSAPTALFGLACLGSLWARRPLLFHFALEFMGPGTPRGRDFAGLWAFPGFRHTLRVITVVWGVAYLLEAAAKLVVVAHFPAGAALALTNVMPFAVAAVLAVWTAVYSARQKRAGERLAARLAAGTRPPDPA